MTHRGRFLLANDNYNAKDEAIFATVDLMHGAQVVSFDEPYGADPALRVGETLPLVAGSEPVSDQGGRISYRSADTSICTVVPATGEMTAVAPGECVVQTKAAAVSNYNATGWIDMATIQVEEGVLPLAWNPQRWGRVGTNLALTAVDTGSLSGVTVTYSVEDAGDTGCTLSGIRTLAFTGTGACVVTATASKTHYEDWSWEHTVLVRPTAITVTPGAFTAGATLQVGDSRTKQPTGRSVTPSDATAVWQLVRGEQDCELVNPQTGAVRAKAVPFEGDIIPQCFLQVVASKPNHETVKSVPVSIALALGTIGDVDIRYGSGVSKFLRTGGTANMTPPPEDGNGVAISIKSIALHGDSNGCGVDTQTGRVTALEDGAVGNVCKVAFTVAATGYADKMLVVDLPLVSEELIFDSDPPPSLSYSGNLQIGDNTPLAATATPSGPDDNGETVTWGYLAEGNCEVSNAGALTLSEDAAAGDICLVRAVASADGFADYSLELVEVTVDAGTLDFTSADKPTFVGTLYAGGTLAPSIPTASADDNSVAVTWENWRMDGNCSVDTATGVVTASDEGDECAVFVTAVAPNYDSLELEIISLTVAAMGIWGPSPLRLTTEN